MVFPSFSARWRLFPWKQIVAAACAKKPLRWLISLGKPKLDLLGLNFSNTNRQGV
jgi:hypothetical protein